MNALRRELLSYEEITELGPEGSFLAGRQATLAVLFIDHTELYRRLYHRYEQDGRSDELDAIALDAAGNLATLLQTLRARQDLLIALARSDDFPAIPVAFIDQLQFSFLLLADQRRSDSDSDSTGYTLDACLSAEEAAGQLEAEITVAWLRDLNADIVMSEPSASRFARELGEDEPADEPA